MTTTFAVFTTTVTLALVYRNSYLYSNADYTAVNYDLFLLIVPTKVLLTLLFTSYYIKKTMSNRTKVGIQV